MFIVVAMHFFPYHVTGVTQNRSPADAEAPLLCQNNPEGIERGDFSGEPTY
jgi:hypothetical protein